MIRATKSFTRIAASTLLCLSITGCDRPGKPDSSATHSPPANQGAVHESSLQVNTWDTFHAQGTRLIEDSKQCLEQLQSSINQLLKETSDANLLASQQQVERCIEKQWITHGLQLAENRAQQSLTRLQRRLLSRLEFPGFVDALQNHPHSGIVQDAALALSTNSLEEQQGVTDDADISLGLDVIAFLLQGEHRYQTEVPLRGSSELRAIEPSELTPQQRLPDHPQQRRRQYVRFAVDIALDDAIKQANLWQREAARAPTSSTWHAWALALAKRQLGLLEHPFISIAAVRAWWMLWHTTDPNTRQSATVVGANQPFSGDNQSLADLLISDQRDAPLRAELAALLADQTSAAPQIMDAFSQWLSHYLLSLPGSISSH